MSSLLARLLIHAEAEGSEAGTTIGPPLFTFAERTVLEQVAVVLGAPVVAEGRSQPPEMSIERYKSQGDANDQEDGANQELGPREVIHLILLCRGLCGRRKGGRVWGSRELRRSVNLRQRNGCSILLSCEK